MRFRLPLTRIAIALGLVLALAGCPSGGSDDQSGDSNPNQAFAGESLTAAEVERILAQAVQEAVARGVSATIAVVSSWL